ncbi:MAG: hypothetical protein BWK75_01640 [Candidatus Altiarchaeales archaeon A3]|nr:MAG: hypothetical protein BWK75_01640 [Candidatus Altiarchaeales archaeon A3]
MGVEKINKSVKFDMNGRLKEVLPEIFEDNKINFEHFKSLLSNEIIEKENDRFYFNWAGKSNIFRQIQVSAYGTLKPNKEISVDFDKTENIVVAGENLETLKLLLKPYFEKVKMIYIDPPYNTGKDFIYRDNFKEPLKDYLEKTGQIDSEGKKLTTNTEASGRYHSDWLNFIYPRLFLARSLLRDDGVIFVSIDDHEVHHLRMIMDEIFGEDNFIGEFAWRKKAGAGADSKYFFRQHEYILFYSRNINVIDAFFQPLTEKQKLEYKNPDNDPRGNWAPTDLKRTGDNDPRRIYKVYSPSGVEFEACWTYTKENFQKLIDANLIWWGKENRSMPKRKRFLNDKEGLIPRSWIDLFLTSDGTKDLEKIKIENLFNYPKPVGLVKHFLQIGTKKDSIILDFFAGSGTTGHAVWDLNKEDGGNRKFILVQLDEEVQNEEIKKEFPTVADICIERLKRVSEKYKQEKEKENNNQQNNNQDFGFKVFKLDKSNFNLKDEFEIPEGENVEGLRQKYLEWLGMWVDEPLVGGWKEINVIYEIMLKEGLNLNSKIEQVKIKEDNFYYVKDAEQNFDFYISLEDIISNETIEEIRTTKYKNKMFMFFDKSLTDNDKINLSSFVKLKVI